MYSIISGWLLFISLTRFSIIAKSIKIDLLDCKVSQIDTETDKAMKMNDLIYKTFTGEVDLDKALKLADKANNHKQNLNKKFIQKTSKKS